VRPLETVYARLEVKKVKAVGLNVDTTAHFSYCFSKPAHGSEILVLFYLLSFARNFSANGKMRTCGDAGLQFRVSKVSV